MVWEEVTVDSWETHHVRCPEGKTAISGSFRHIDGSIGPAEWTILGSEKSSTSGFGEAWRFEVFVHNGTHEFQFGALCAEAA